MKAAAKIRVLLVDDQKLFIDSLRFVLQSTAPDIEIVEVARDGARAVVAAREHDPDVVLMDVRMPGLDGIEATRAILRQVPRARILMLSAFDDGDTVRKAVGSGAVGYLHKNLAPAQVVQAIRGAAAGIVQFMGSVARAFAGTAAAAPAMKPPGAASGEALTPREKQVLALIMESRDNREIASRLNVSQQTARNYVSNLYAKMVVTNRMQLQRLARELGLYPLQDPTESSEAGPGPG